MFSFFLSWTKLGSGEKSPNDWTNFLILSWCCMNSRFYESFQVYIKVDMPLNHFQIYLLCMVDCDWFLLYLILLYLLMEGDIMLKVCYWCSCLSVSFWFTPLLVWSDVVVSGQPIFDTMDNGNWISGILMWIDVLNQYSLQVYPENQLSFCIVNCIKGFIKFTWSSSICIFSWWSQVYEGVICVSKPQSWL